MALPLLCVSSTAPGASLDPVNSRVSGNSTAVHAWVISVLSVKQYYSREEGPAQDKKSYLVIGRSLPMTHMDDIHTCHVPLSLKSADGMFAGCTSGPPASDLPPDAEAWPTCDNSNRGGICANTCSSNFVAGPDGPPTATCLCNGAWSVTGSCIPDGEFELRCRLTLCGVTTILWC